MYTTSPMESEARTRALEEFWHHQDDKRSDLSATWVSPPDVRAGSGLELDYLSGDEPWDDLVVGLVHRHEDDVFRVL